MSKQFNNNAMKKLKHLFILCTMIVVTLILNTRRKVKFNHIEACFTPSEKCTPFITQTIKLAKKTIYVQAYTWTSQEISEVLVQMKNQGVKVQILLDKVNLNKNNALTLLQENGINVMVDYVPGIAHNKIILVDDDITITGSFNFSRAADTKNVENVLKIQSKEVNEIYLQNWNKRKQYSQDIDHVIANQNVYKPWKETSRRTYMKVKKPIIKPGNSYVFS